MKKLDESFLKTIINSNGSLTQYLIENKNSINEDLNKRGAILFRNFDINSVNEFQEFILSLEKNTLEYKLRSSPRNAIGDNIYVSTTYPKTQKINMHSESSYAMHSPSNIIFCCVQPAISGGETPIADNRLVLDYIDDKIIEKVKTHGILYNRNMGGFMGMKWEEVFQTSDKNEVENICQENKINFEWKNSNHLSINWKKKGIWESPISKELVWFNHAMFFNKLIAFPELLDFVSSDDELPSNTYYGDGSEFSKGEIENIKKAYNKATIEFVWKKGDVLYLNNMLISHGRNSYVGEREIIVSMY